MDQRRTLIKDFEKQIDLTELEISGILLQTGEYLFTAAKKDTRAASQEEYDAAKHQLELRKQYEETAGRIQSIMDRMGEIGKELGETRSRIEVIARSNQPVYEQIGQAAYEYLKGDPHLYNQYNDIFADVNNQMDDIDNIEQDIENIQAKRQDRKFFEKIADTGQVTYLKGVRALRAKTMPKLYRDAGIRLTETNFLETTGNDGVQNAAKLYLANKNELLQLGTRKTSLDDELKELDTELTGLGVDKKSDRRLEELKGNIASATAKYEEKITALAVKIRGATPEAIEEREEYTGFIAKIASCEGKIGKARENITKLEAAIEVDNLTKQIERMNTSIEDHKLRITEHENSIEDLKKRIEQSGEDKKRFEEIRGPEEITLQS